MDEKLQRRNQAMYWAVETNKFSPDKTLDDHIEAAKKIEEFFNAE